MIKQECIGIPDMILLLMNFLFQSRNSTEPAYFLLFCKKMDVKKISKCLPFTVFGIVSFFKLNNFCLKIRFSQAQHPISDLFFFLKDRCFFYATFFQLFSSKPPSIFTRNETFREHKALLKVFGTMRLTGDLHQKNRKMFSSNLFFF